MSVRNGQITVNIPGRGDTTFDFGMGAWYDFTKRQNVPVTGIFTVLKADHPEYLTAIRDLLYCSAAYHLEQQNKKVDFTPAKVFGWIDAIEDEDFLKIIECMQESKFLGNFLGLKPPSKPAAEAPIQETPTQE